MTEWVNNLPCCVWCVLFLIVMLLAGRLLSKKWDYFKEHGVLILICGISLLLSSAALLHILSGKTDENSYAGTLVTVLGILITVLIGWNVSQLIDIKGYKKQIEDLDAKYDDRFRKMVNENYNLHGDINLEFARMSMDKGLSEVFLIYTLEALYNYTRSDFANSIGQANTCVAEFNARINLLPPIVMSEEKYASIRNMLTRIKRQNEIQGFDEFARFIFELNPRIRV